MAAPESTRRVFLHLNADKGDDYRAVMRVFHAAKEGFRLHLRPADVVALLDRGDHPRTQDEVRALLAQLVEWGNLRADPDHAEVATVEEFYRPRFLYQLTAEGEAAERALRHFEAALVRSGELQTAALDDVRALLAELLGLVTADHLDAAKCHRVLVGLTGRLAELTDRAQTFLVDLQRTIELQGLKLEAFVAYKDRLIEYLERFVGELVRAQSEVARLIAGVEAADVEPVLVAVADRDLADALDPTADDRADAVEEWRRRWEGLHAWFVATGPVGSGREPGPVGSGREPGPVGSGRDSDGSRQAQADVLRARARQAIPDLLLAVSRINEQRISRTDRPADLRTLARWFAQAPTDADAHRLWRAAFGLAPSRHLQIDGDTLDARGAHPVAPSTSWLDADPLQVAPRLRRTGRYLRRGRPTSVVDRSREKELLARQAAAEARQLAAARAQLATDGRTRLSALGQLDRDAFGLLLDLLGEALARKVRPDETVRATSADGGLEIVLAPAGDGTTATIDTADGALHGPDHHVEIRDLLAGDDAAAHHALRADLEVPA